MTTETPPEADKPKEEAKGMRAQIESLSAENRELKAEKRDDIVAGLGLVTDSGLGMALVEQFDKGDLPLDDIAKTATEKYGHVVPDAQPPAHPQAQAIATAQAAVDNLDNAAGSIKPPSQDDTLAKAESEQDFNTTIAMKGARINEMLRP